ncbi:MAG TPA: hypothetical protein VFI31_14650 [Pirellulales bacterium]|nr:hypothetical protein [Pirellulales bacterium]
MASDDFDDEAAGATAAAETKQNKPAAASGERPWLDRTLLNLRVWLPVLRTPDMKLRQVKYRSSDARSGMTWKVALPKQCYACGKTDDLTLRKFSQEVRVFDAPTTIMGGTIGGVLILLLLGIFFLSLPLLMLSVVIAVMGSALQFVKSWTERVRINLFTCPEHLEDLTPPEVVSYDEDLYVYLPHESLAEPARAELIESRKKGQKQKPPLASDITRASPQEPPPSETSDAPPPRPMGARAELPPLRLAGEEEQ